VVGSGLGQFVRKNKLTKLPPIITTKKAAISGSLFLSICNQTLLTFIHEERYVFAIVTRAGA
jgi:hypothetical protein